MPGRRANHLCTAIIGLTVLLNLLFTQRQIGDKRDVKVLFYHFFDVSDVMSPSANLSP